MEYKTNCLILGSGGAGYTAGIYTARANLQPILITGNDIGGQLATTSDVENFPGFKKILGAELMDKMREQAIKCGAQIIQDNIIDVEDIQDSVESVLKDEKQIDFVYVGDASEEKN